MESVIERQRKRFRFLKLLYDKSYERLDDPVFSAQELGNELGFAPAETSEIVSYLRAQDLLSPHSGRAVIISYDGVKEVEDVLTNPGKPTEHFPAGVVHALIPFPASSTVDERTEMVKVFISHSSKDVELASEPPPVWWRVS